MPHLPDLNSTVSSVDALSQLASRFMAEFEKGFSLRGPLNVEFVLHQTRSGFPGRPGGPLTSPVISKQDGHRALIHLYGPGLMDIPIPALQGWIDLELAALSLSLQDGAFKFNFNREILPLMDVSGAAKQFIRYLVFNLETLVKRIQAVQLLLDMDHGLPLCAYYYTTISPSGDDKENYENLLPHRWTKAIFICKKCKEYNPLIFLAQQGIFTELETYWWACHDYILPEDRRLMEGLADISLRSDDSSFSEQIVLLFQAVKSNLLI